MKASVPTDGAITTPLPSSVPIADPLSTSVSLEQPRFQNSQGHPAACPVARAPSELFEIPEPERGAGSAAMGVGGGDAAVIELVSPRADETSILEFNARPNTTSFMWKPMCPPMVRSPLRCLPLYRLLILYLPALLLNSRSFRSREGIPQLAL